MKMMETLPGKYLKFIEKRPCHLQALKKLQDERLKNAEPEEILFAMVFAPVICAYTEWVLRKAAGSEITKLYFLSRDGYMPIAVAERLKDSICPDVELKYLNVSRFSLRSAQYYICGEGCLDTICTGGIGITFEKMMRRAQLTDDECAMIASAVGMSNSADRALDYRSILKIKEKLRSVPEFFEMVREHAKDPYENVRGYLLQEGLDDEGTKGIVDTGWIGTAIYSLLELMGTDVGLHGYYFGLYELPDKLEKRFGQGCDCDSYYIKPRGRSGDGIRNLKRKKNFSIGLFETVCSSPEGMTVRYEKNDNGRFVPVTDMDRNPNSEHIERYHEIIKEYAREYALQISHADYTYDKSMDLDMAEGIMSSLMGNPSFDEASVLGGLKFCDDVLQSDLRCVAEKISKDDIARDGLLKRLFSKAGAGCQVMPASAWTEGSIASAFDEKDSSDKKKRNRAIKTEHKMRVLTEIRKAL